MFGAGLPAPSKRLTAGLLFLIASSTKTEDETCGQIPGGVGRPAPNNDYLSSPWPERCRPQASAVRI